METGSSKPKSKIDVAIGLATGDALLPLLKARDNGEAEVSMELWREIYSSVEQTIAEVYFGTNDRMRQLDDREGE